MGERYASGQNEDYENQIYNMLVKLADKTYSSQYIPQNVLNNVT